VVSMGAILAKWVNTTDFKNDEGDRNASAARRRRRSLHPSNVQTCGNWRLLFAECESMVSGDRGAALMHLKAKYHGPSPQTAARIDRDQRRHTRTMKPSIPILFFENAGDLLEKAQRDFDRMQQLKSDQVSISFADALYDFCITAYHAIEWAQKDGSVAQAVTDRLRADIDIRRCRDYATVGKHFLFNEHGAKADIQDVGSSLNAATSTPTHWVKMTALSSERIRVLEIAESVLKKLRQESK
jgi:hypothetical protein